jgi:hypothetical protein
LEGNHLCQECDGTGWVLYRSETINGGFGKPTAPVPKATRHATAWGTVTIDFAPVPPSRDGALRERLLLQGSCRVSTTVGMLTTLARRFGILGPSGLPHFKK